MAACGDADRLETLLCVQTSEGVAPVALDAGADTKNLAGLFAATDGDDTWLALGPLLVRARCARGRVVDAAVPKDTRALAVTGDHRPIVLTAGALHRLDAGTWQVVSIR